MEKALKCRRKAQKKKKKSGEKAPNEGIPVWKEQNSKEKSWEFWFGKRKIPGEKLGIPVWREQTSKKRWEFRLGKSKILRKKIWETAKFQGKSWKSGVWEDQHSREKAGNSVPGTGCAAPAGAEPWGAPGWRPAGGREQLPKFLLGRGRAGGGRG